ncbi:ribonuclease T2 family protein [Hoeflea sp.]|uniref:ribonuclease T2 family protein n=1 Tax=Hoeflea sp. TaxID=1940281 RepID=UPI003BB13352
MAETGGMATLAAAAVLMLVSACSDEPGSVSDTETRTVSVSQANAAEVPIGSGFDFYVLALSWSPAYCIVEGDRANRQQCAPDRDLAFVVHGLWPQFKTGYPEYCPSRQPERVPTQLGNTYLDVLPSMGLIGHQWRKHGACSGLTQKDYFDLTRAARQRIVIPDDFAPANLPGEIGAAEAEDAFVAVNPGLSREGIAVRCERGMLREIRICLSTTLGFRDCPEVDRNGCTRTGLDIPEPG